MGNTLDALKTPALIKDDHDQPSYSHWGMSHHQNDRKEKKKRKIHKRGGEDIGSETGNRKKCSKSQLYRDQVNPVISEFHRKKYKSRKQDVNNDQERIYYRELQSYIHDLVSFLSLRLAFDSGVADFKIATDERKWQSFGDIVIEVTVKKGKQDTRTVHAIKCKQISKNYKKIERLGDAKINLDKEYATLAALKNIEDFDKTNFSIFTTCTVTSRFCDTEKVDIRVLKHRKKHHSKAHETPDACEPTEANILVKPFIKRNLLLNITNDPGNVFTVHPEKEIKDLCLPTMFIYTSQGIFPTMCRDILKNTFQDFENVNREIQDYMKYIRQWSEGKLGGHYYLNRNDVILKIGEIFLSPYVVAPMKTVKLTNNDFEIWNRVVENVDLIVMKSEPPIITKICEPLNQLIEHILAGKIDDISNSMTITESIFEKIQGNPMMKAYFFEETGSGIDESEVNISKLYRLFWKTGNIPLLLSIESAEDHKDLLLDVMFFMERYGVKKKFLLITAHPFFAKPVQHGMRIFNQLDDVKDLVDLTQIGLNNAKYTLTLDTISQTDQFFLKWVTPNIFFEMALGNFQFEVDRSKRERTTSDMKITLNDNNIRELQESLQQVEASDTEQKPRGIDRGRLRDIDPGFFVMG